MKFTYWTNGEFWLGYLDEYTDYLTQGTSFEDLKAHLLDIFGDFYGGAMSCEI